MLEIAVLEVKHQKQMENPVEVFLSEFPINLDRQPIIKRKMWQRPCLKFTLSLSGVSKLCHFTICIWLVLLLLCCVMSQVQEHHEIGYRFWHQWRLELLINSPIHIYFSPMLHYIILMHMMYKVLPCSNHHSFLPMDCAAAPSLLGG